MRSGDWDLLGVTTAAFFVTMVARLAPSPLVPDVMAAFGVSKSAVGIALSGMWMAYALFQFPGGVVAERVGERRVVLFAVGATGLASALLAAAPSFPLFAVLVVGVGAMAGFYFPAGTSFLTAQYENTGRALGVHEIGASAAGLFAPVAATAVARRFDWRGGLLVPGAVALVVFVLFWWLTPRTEPSNPDVTLGEQLELDRLVALVARPSILFTTVLMMVGFFTWQAFASFFPTFLVEYGDLTAARASVVFGAVFAVTLVGAPTLGWASERTGRDLAAGLSFASGAAGFVLFLAVGGQVAVVAGSALLGLGLCWPGVVNARLMDHLSTSERGTGLGLVRTLVLLVSSLGSGVTGTLADVADWRVAYGLVAALFAGLVALLLANHLLDLEG